MDESELQEALLRLEEAGGPKGLERQRKAGKKTARERIEALADPGTFTEIDRFVTTRSTDFGLDQKRFYGDGVVTGSMRINGQRVMVAVEDFTVLGGSLGEMHAAKIAHALELATETGVPFLQLNDSGGARIQEGVAALNGYGRIFRANTHASGIVPQISMVLGPCAGGAAYSPGLTDFVFMVRGISHMFITGPDVIRTVTGEEVGFDTLGGADAHAMRSGNVHFASDSEDEALHTVKRLLSFLPANNRESPPTAEPAPPQAAPLTRDSIPADAKTAYDVRTVMAALVDGSDMLEVHAEFAQNVVTAFARMDGRSIGVVANQPAHMAGVLDIDGADKIARFVRFCDAFNLPVVNLVDVPGFLPGVGQEHEGIIRHGAKLLYAYADACVPKIAVVLRKAYGGAYIGMCSRDLGYDRIFALDGAQIAVMGPEGAVNILYRRELQAADDPDALRKSLVAEYEDRFTSPFAAAELGLVDNVVRHERLREELIAALDMTGTKRMAQRPRRHGNIPL